MTTSCQRPSSSWLCEWNASNAVSRRAPFTTAKKEPLDQPAGELALGFGVETAFGVVRFPEARYKYGVLLDHTGETQGAIEQMQGQPEVRIRCEVTIEDSDAHDLYGVPA